MPTAKTRKKRQERRQKAKSNNGFVKPRKGTGAKQVFIVKNKKKQRLNTSATALLEIKRCQAFIIINYLEKLGSAREVQETELLRQLRKLKFK